jgi:peptidoglycan LD-endopeptidase LytH
MIMPVHGLPRPTTTVNRFGTTLGSVTHKGVDVFAKLGTPVVAATGGLVVYRGEVELGGKVVLVLGPKWRLHYYAHLHQVTAPSGWVGQGTTLGTVGTTGSAAGKPPHLHYSIVTLLSYPWRIDGDRQGWKKMFYLNPIDYLVNLWARREVPVFTHPWSK